MNKKTIVSMSDKNYFELLLELIESIQRFPQSKDIDICVLDAGLTSEQKNILSKKVNEIKKAVEFLMTKLIIIYPIIRFSRALRSINPIPDSHIKGLNIDMKIASGITRIKPKKDWSYEPKVYVLPCSDICECQFWAVSIVSNILPKKLDPFGLASIYM